MLPLRCLLAGLGVQVSGVGGLTHSGTWLHHGPPKLGLTLIQKHKAPQNTTPHGVVLLRACYKFLSFQNIFIASLGRLNLGGVGVVISVPSREGPCVAKGDTTRQM